MTNLPFQFVPVALASMLIAILLECRLAVLINVALSIVCALIGGTDAQAMAYYMITGSFAAVISGYTTQRSKTLFVSIAAGAVSFSVMFAFSALVDKGFSDEGAGSAILAALSGMLTVILSIGTLPAWEILFGIVTPIKMLDYANPNNKLLRRLTIEAPGTYHHSIITANLAETAAFDIGADPALARVGAYYHDIGKLKHPLYYAENQLGENIHDYIDPIESASIIISHGKDGADMARANKLPPVVVDIIEQHHGTTMIKYFYYKAVNAYPDEDIDEADFHYKGPKPSFKESALVMLADTVEAAVRSRVSASNLDEIGNFVRELIKDKLDDGQLIDSGLTIKDLDTAAESFIRVFKGMYHERVAYPKSTMEEIRKMKTEKPEKA
jgi:putative nucleotidyltransferase with HDIG domain